MATPYCRWFWILLLFCSIKTSDNDFFTFICFSSNTLCLLPNSRWMFPTFLPLKRIEWAPPMNWAAFLLPVKTWIFRYHRNQPCRSNLVWKSKRWFFKKDCDAYSVGSMNVNGLTYNIDYYFSTNPKWLPWKWYLHSLPRHTVRDRLPVTTKTLLFLKNKNTSLPNPEKFCNFRFQLDISTSPCPGGWPNSKSTSRPMGLTMHQHST